MENKKTLSISIVIPAMDEEKYLTTCLESIEKYKTEALLEIIIVDNGSTDRTRNIAELHKGVRVIYEKDPLGLPLARERGFVEARGDLIASLDADNEITEHWFTQIQQEFEDPSLGCLTGPYKYRGFSLLLSMIHTSLRVIIHGIFLHVFGFLLSGGNFVMRRSLYEKIGHFNCHTSYWGEDCCMGQKIHVIGKMKYSHHFVAFSSSRRWKKEGAMKLGIKYVVSLFSQGMKRTVTDSYCEIR